MCFAPKQKSDPPPLPKERAAARAPQKTAQAAMPRTAINGGQPMSTANASRSTVVNPDGIILRAPTARMGGSSVVLGG